MDIDELYKEMKLKLKYMYDNGKTEVMLEQYEFFALFRILCDMIQIKHIAEHT